MEPLQICSGSKDLSTPDSKPNHFELLLLNSLILMSNFELKKYRLFRILSIVINILTKSSEFWNYFKNSYLVTNIFQNFKPSFSSFSKIFKIVLNSLSHIFNKFLSFESKILIYFSTIYSDEACSNSEKILIHVYYASINTRDLMLASGKMSVNECFRNNLEKVRTFVFERILTQVGKHQKKFFA